MNQYQNPYYMVPQRWPRAWINGTLIILNILYFLYLELTGSTEDAYFMLEHGPCMVRLSCGGMNITGC